MRITITINGYTVDVGGKIMAKLSATDDTDFSDVLREIIQHRIDTIEATNGHSPYIQKLTTLMSYLP